MRIFLLRHGDAGPYTTPDEARALSKLGQNQISRVVAHRQSELAHTEVCMVSPYVRAQQTADILLTRFPNILRMSADWIVPSANIDFAIESLYKLSQKHASMILVSHNPFITHLLQALCGTQAYNEVMETGSLAAIETDVVARNCADLKWLTDA